MAMGSVYEELQWSRVIIDVTQMWRKEISWKFCCVYIKLRKHII